MERIAYFALIILICVCCKEEPVPPSSYNTDCLLLDYSQFSSQAANTFKANLPFDQPSLDLWGYTDEADGKEYILVGYGKEDLSTPEKGIYIVDVSNSNDPQLVQTIEDVGGFDIKTYQHYAYSVTGINSFDGHIIDIKDPENPVLVGRFPGGHNIFISCSNLLIVSNPGGLEILDLNNSPTDPVSIWRDRTIEGHEAAILSNILYSFSGREGTRIYDLTNPEDPQLLSTITSDMIKYHHSGWTDEGENILIITDEIPFIGAVTGYNFTIWNISDKRNPSLLGQFRDEESDIHNVHIIKNKAYFSHYAAGYRVFDIGNPAEPNMIFEYDTSPDTTGANIWNGAFGIYALSPSGNTFVSDMNNGLFIFGN